MLIDNLPHECTIRRKTRVKGALQGAKNVPVNEQTGVKCWEQPAGDSEIKDFQQQGMKITHVVRFTSDPAVGSRHQILITKRKGVTVTSPIALDVVSESAPDDSAGLGILYKVMCNRITAGET